MQSPTPEELSIYQQANDAAAYLDWSRMNAGYHVDDPDPAAVAALKDNR